MVPLVCCTTTLTYIHIFIQKGPCHSPGRPWLPFASLECVDMYARCVHSMRKYKYMLKQQGQDNTRSPQHSQHSAGLKSGQVFDPTSLCEGTYRV